MSKMDSVTIGGVTIEEYNPNLHEPHHKSAKGVCAQGGEGLTEERCRRPVEHSVHSSTYRIATCSFHLYGAVQRARPAS